MRTIGTYKSYENLLRRLAWSFHNTNGVEWEELFAEAKVAFCHARRKFDPEKGAKFSTYLYQVVRMHLIKFSYKTTPHIKPNSLAPQNLYVATYNKLTPESWFGFREALVGLSKDANAICEMIMKTPSEFASMARRNAETAVKEQLKQEGWSARRQRHAITEIKLLIANS